MKRWGRRMLVGAAVLCGALALTVGAYAVNRVEGGYLDLAVSRDFWIAVVLTVLAAAFAVAQDRAARSVVRGPMGPRHAPEIASRLEAAGRGVRQASHDGDFFTGRSRALAEIGGWLRDPGGSRALVVTGPAGMGKSAIVGHVAKLATTGQPVGDGAVWRGRVVTIDAAAHSPLVVAQVVAEKVAGVQIAAVHELDAAIKDGRGRPSDQVLVVVDGVDETPGHEGGYLAREVLHRLGGMEARFGVRLLVGTRPDHHGDDLVGPLSRAVVVDLREEKYFDVRDMVRYVKRLLQQERDGNPYLDDAVAVPLAERIAQGARRVFLVAAIVAYDLGRTSTRAIDVAKLAIPGDLETALMSYLDRCEHLGTLRAREVLEPLAYAESPGMSGPVWAAALTGMTGQQISSVQLAAYARNVIGDYLVPTRQAAGRSAYRLFHQSLNDTLVARDDDQQVEDNAAITDALLRQGNEAGWDEAPAYLLRSLSWHAIAGGKGPELVALMARTDYLLHADLPRLHAALGRTDDPAARAYRALIGTTAQAAQLSPGTRAAAFSLTAAFRGDSGTRAHFAELAEHLHGPYAARWAHTRLSASVEHLLDDHTSSVEALTVLPDGRIASGGRDGTILVWDLTAGTGPLALPSHPLGLHALAVLPDGRIVSGGDDGTVRVWEPTPDADPLTLVGHTGPVRAVAVLPDGRIVSGSDDRTLRVWDPTGASDPLVLVGHTGWVRAVVVLPDGRIVSGSEDRTVRLWDPDAGTEPLVMQGHELGVSAVVVLPDGRIVSGSDDGTGRVWDAAAGTESLLLEGHGLGVGAMAVLPDGRVVSGDFAGTVRVWELTLGAHSLVLEGHTDWVTALTALPDGRIVSGSHDRTVRVWDPGADPMALNSRARGVNAVVIVPDGRIVSGGVDRTVRVSHPVTGSELLVLRGHTGPVEALAVLPDGRIVSGSDDRTVRVWDLSSGSDPLVLLGPTGSVDAVAVTTDGGIIAGGSDKRVRVWGPVAGSDPLARHRYSYVGWVRAVAALSDGRILVGCSDGTLWDPVAGSDPLVLRGHTGSVEALAVLSDRRIVSGSSDGAVRVWDPNVGPDPLVLRGHTDWVRAVAVLPDGRVVSGSDDRTVRIWDLEAEVSMTMRVGEPVRALAPGIVGDRDRLVIAQDSGMLAIDLLPSVERGAA